MEFSFLNHFNNITHSIIANIDAITTFNSIRRMLSPNIMMLSIINDMPIIPMIAPMTNNSIITSIAPTKNSNTEIRLTSPLIKS